jgi:hypothetical protein
MSIVRVHSGVMLLWHFFEPLLNFFLALSLVVMAMDERGSFWEWPWEVGKMVGDFGDVHTKSWVTSNSSSLTRNAAQKEIELRASSMLEVEEDAWGSISSNSGDVEGVEVVQQVAGDLQQQGVGAILLLSSSPLLLLLLSPLLSSFASLFLFSG